LIAVFVGAFALAPVLLSHDAFSYVDYARLGVHHGLDPYTHAPEAAPADSAFADVTWTETTSAYGPLFTLATFPLAWLPVGLAVAALKALAALSVAALAVLVSRLAAWRGLDPLRAAAFLALNPLVLVHVVGGAHNDGLAMLFAMLGVAAVLAGLQATGGASLVVAAATKASALILLPFPLLAHPRSINRLAAGAVGAALAIGLAAYLAFGWDWTHAFGLAGENQDRTSHMSIPITLARLTGLGAAPVRVAALGLYGLGFASLLVWTRRGGDWVRAAAWASLGLLLATSWLLPWYLIWALPLVAISRDRPLALLTLGLTAYQLGARIPL
jgi:uncharacterized membrane protein